jgi:hypothetical protein
LTDTEILEAIIAHKLWVHPAGRAMCWTAMQDGGGEYFAHNRLTLRDAVRDALAAGSRALKALGDEPE